MFWDRLSIQSTWIVSFFQMSVGSDSDFNKNEKDPHQQSVQENEIEIFEEILENVHNILNKFPDMFQSLIFQLTHRILISIPMSSTNLFFQPKHWFNRISIPIPSTNLLF